MLTEQTTDTTDEMEAFMIFAAWMLDEDPELEDEIEDATADMLDSAEVWRDSIMELEVIAYQADVLPMDLCFNTDGFGVWGIYPDLDYEV